MCGRFTLATPTGELERRFGVAIADGSIAPRYNIAPTEQVLAVTLADQAEATPQPQRTARLLCWGLIPSGARDPKLGSRMINARSETAEGRGAFKKLLQTADRRALVPADGWYEWLVAEDARQPRQPFRFTVDGGAPFAFAGLWTTAWIDDDCFQTLTIMTTRPNALAATIHDRMPVVLAGVEAEQAWLDPRVGAGEALSLCEPLAAARLQVAPANPRVNRSGLDNDDAGLLQAPAPVEPAQASLFAT